MLLFLSSSCLAQNAPSSKAFGPEVNISVYEEARVPTELLAAAEVQVHRVFQQAGVATIWRNCSGFISTTSLSVIPNGPACLSRVAS